MGTTYDGGAKNRQNRRRDLALRKARDTDDYGFHVGRGPSGFYEIQKHTYAWAGPERRIGPTPRPPIAFPDH